MHQRDQLVEGGLISLPPCEEKSGDLARVAGNAPILRFFSPRASHRTSFPASVGEQGDTMAKTPAGVVAMVAMLTAGVAARIAPLKVQRWSSSST